MASSRPRRNQAKRLFRRPKDLRCNFRRFDKLDVTFTAHLSIALVVEALR